MPPRRGTPWASHSSLLSDRIRPRSDSPQPTKLEKGKGKGKSKATTPEPPPRSAAVRRLDELLGGLHSLSASSQPPKNETKRATTAAGAASADREGCFCQGTSPFFYLFLHLLPFETLFDSVSQSIPSHHTPNCSPGARIIRIHAHLLILRSRPLRLTPPTPSLPTLHTAAARAARADGARRAAGGTPGGYAQGGGCGAREGGGGTALG